MSKGSAKDVAALVAAAGELVGRTRLQKIGVLLELTGVGFGFSYDYHLFGPYSEELAGAADRAVALGYITEEVKRSAWGSSYSIFRSSHERKNTESLQQIVLIAKSADSIVLELMATAAFLASEGYEDAWAEVEARKPEKITRARISQARQLYHQVSRIAVPKPLPIID